MRNSILSLTTMICGIALSHAAIADLPVLEPKHDQALNKTEMMLNASLGQGGDRMAQVENEFGHTQKMDAGSGVVLGVGLRHTLSTETPIFFEGSFNIMYNSINGEEWDAKFTRFPLDLLVGTQFKKVRLAGGFTHHLSPTYELSSEDENASDATVNFDDATGTALEASYALTKRGDLGVRYTQIEYTVGGFKLDGSNVAVKFTAHF